MFAEGDCVSNAAGIRFERQFGVRLGNVLICREHPEHPNFLCWENATVAPYSRHLIEKSLLSDDTIAYIDEYHLRCRNVLAPLLQGDRDVTAYL